MILVSSDDNSDPTSISMVCWAQSCEVKPAGRGGACSIFETLRVAAVATKRAKRQSNTTSRFNPSYGQCQTHSCNLEYR